MLLNKQPRWLRPKNTLQINQRVSGLSECRTNRRTKRNLVLSYKDEEDQYGLPKSLLSTTLPTPFNSTDTLSDLISDELGEGWRPGLPGHEDDVQYSLATWDLKALFPEEYFDSHDPLPTIGEELENIAGDQQTLSTHWSTSSIKRRLPKYSSKELKGFVKLMKAHSISNSSAATINGTAVTFTTAKPATYECPSVLSKAHSSADEAVGPLLADSLLVADWHKERQGLCIPGLPSHDLKSCWCAAIEDLKSNCQTWIDPSWTIDVTHPAENLFDLNLAFQDDFGNTALHFLAARGASMAVIINAIEHGADPHPRNTANQSFLHLFPGGLINELARRPYELGYNLQKLQSLGVRFYDCDHFGRTPLHNLPSYTVTTYPHSLWRIAKQIRLPTSRDACGYIPTLDFPQIEAPLDIFQVVIPPVLRSELHPAKIFPTRTKVKLPRSISPFVSESWLSIQTRLLETARLAFDMPNIEDQEGRNGLQCLAEVSLTMIINDGEVQPVSHRKRKRNESDPVPSASRLTLRYELVQKMIYAGVDINHFDKKGNPVLMAFVTHLPDGEDDKTLRILLNYLIDKGANLHYRNRQGETALHVTVRLGRKVATMTLLQNGANIHARTTDGKGVLAVGEKAYFDAKDIENQQLYASIMACHALAFQYGAVPGPTIVQEWSKNEGFAMYLKLQNSLAKRCVKKKE